MAALQPLPYSEWRDGYDLHMPDGQAIPYKKYRYQRRLPQRTIRLIYSQRSRHYRHFSIKEKFLDEPGLEYVALSYAWGNSDERVPLLLTEGGDSSVLLVTPNAWEAVNRLCVAAPIWIDQICINQEDDEEITEQIRFMGDIYRHCWCCAIWLGPADEHTTTAFNFVRRLVGPDGLIPEAEHFPVLPRSLVSMKHSQIRNVLHEKGLIDKLPVSTDPGWAALANCLFRPWYTRLWTFQEAVLPASVLVCCGGSTVTLIAFTRAAYLLGNEDDFGAKHALGRGSLVRIDRMRHSVQNNQPRPLSLLLDNVMTYDCTKHRDRIYAVMGLQAEDVDIDPIIVNLEQPIDHLYIDVTRKIIKARSSLLICTYASGFVGGEVENLPSWVPDWTATPKSRPFERHDRRDTYFRADKGRPHLELPNTVHLKLWAKGGIVDKITEVVQSDMADEMTIRARKDYLVKELFPLLLVLSKSISHNDLTPEQMHKVVKTITLNGYTRQSNLGPLDFAETAWNEESDSRMLGEAFAIARGTSLTQRQVDFDVWFTAFSMQAQVLADRRLAILRKNWLGLVPRDSQHDDLVVILHGLSIPVILREAGDVYRMIGPCFVDGVMYGEATIWDARKATPFCIC